MASIAEARAWKDFEGERAGSMDDRVPERKRRRTPEGIGILPARAFVEDLAAGRIA
jgi:hypothetical protein